MKKYFRIDFYKEKFLNTISGLQGNPRFIAFGMAIGVFVGITPTIPFHTIFALILAFIFRASKTASVAGVWIANPITIPIFYIASYKIGLFYEKDRDYVAAEVYYREVISKYPETEYASQAEERLKYVLKKIEKEDEKED